MSRKRPICAFHLYIWDKNILSHRERNGKLRCQHCDECMKIQKILNAEHKIIWEEQQRIKKITERSAIKKKKKEEECRITQISDHKVQLILNHGMKSNQIIKFPEEIVQLKKATMLAKRAILRTKLDRKKAKEKYIEELLKREERIIAARMQKYGIRPDYCEIHGTLHHQDLVMQGKSPSGIQIYKCKKCRRDTYKNHYENNKNEILKKHAEYRKNNPEKIK